MINERMADQLAKMLLKTNPEPEFDIALGGERASVENVAAALQKHGCSVELHNLYLHIVRMKPDQ